MANRTDKVDWITVRNEYINGNISYDKLAIKYKVSPQRIAQRGKKESWRELKAKQHEKINAKLAEKTAEKLANAEANRLARISKAADNLLLRLEKATEELDQFLAKDKRKYSKKATGKDGETIDVYVEEEVPKIVNTGKVNVMELNRLASTLKDLKDIQYSQTETGSEVPTINITITAATAEDMEEGD